MDENNLQQETQQLEAKFTQNDIDRIVQDRLARERQKYEGHDDLKGVVEELSLFGYTGSPQDIRNAVRAQREAYQQQAELEQLQQQAEENGITPSLAKEIKELKDELKKTKTELDGILGERKAKQEALEKQKEIDEQWNNQIAEFEEAYPDANLDEIGKNQKFIDFIEGSGWSIKTAYTKFIKVYGEIESDVISKVKSKELRSTSYGKGSDAGGGGTSLTAEQKATVDKWNQQNPKMRMTYKEYAEKL